MRRKETHEKTTQKHNFKTTFFSTKNFFISSTKMNLIKKKLDNNMINLICTSIDLNDFKIILLVLLIYLFSP